MAGDSYKWIDEAHQVLDALERAQLVTRYDRDPDVTLTISDLMNRLVLAVTDLAVDVHTLQKATDTPSRIADADSRSARAAEVERLEARLADLRSSLDE